MTSNVDIVHEHVMKVALKTMIIQPIAQHTLFIQMIKSNWQPENTRDFTILKKTLFYCQSNIY